jgi:hypothetical protein
VTLLDASAGTLVALLIPLVIVCVLGCLDWLEQRVGDGRWSEYDAAPLAGSPEHRAQDAIAPQEYEAVEHSPFGPPELRPVRQTWDESDEEGTP